MIQLPKPKFSVADVVKDCVIAMNPIQNPSQYLNAIEIIEQQTNLLDTIMTEKTNDTVRWDGILQGGASQKDMAKLYTQYFVPQTKVCRTKYYDKLLVSVNEKCPFCGVGTISNLDHFLVKSKYTYLTISPINLVPICRDCNMGAKKEIEFPTYADSHLHPYYDDVTKHIWLEANILNQNGVAVANYTVVQPDGLNDMLFKRIEIHFSLFKLAKVFGLQANDEIRNQTHRWREMKLTAGIETLKDDILCSVRSYEASRNIWKAALYRALAHSEWFLNKCIL